MSYSPQRNLLAAIRCAEQLDRHADHAGLEEQQPVAGWIAVAIARQHGIGSWGASHALRNTTRREVELILLAWGASPFTIEQHAEPLRELIVSDSFLGGSARRQEVEA